MVKQGDGSIFSKEKIEPSPRFTFFHEEVAGYGNHRGKSGAQGFAG